MEMDKRKRRMSFEFDCYTIQIDDRSIAIVHNKYFFRTGNIDIIIPDSSSDPHSNSTMFLAEQINMKRFMFKIFGIEQNVKHLIAQINTISANSSKLPTFDAYSFTVDINEQTNDKQIEIILMLCLMIDEMRDFASDDLDDMEEFYDKNENSPT